MKNGEGFGDNFAGEKTEVRLEEAAALPQHTGPQRSRGRRDVTERKKKSPDFSIK